MGKTNNPYGDEKESRQDVKKMKLSEYMRGYSDDEIMCKNCSYIAFECIREDLNEPVFCKRKKGLVELISSCSEFIYKSSNLLAKMPLHKGA